MPTRTPSPRVGRTGAIRLKFRAPGPLAVRRCGIFKVVPRCQCQGKTRTAEESIHAVAETPPRAEARSGVRPSSGGRVQSRCRVLKTVAEWKLRKRKFSIGLFAMVLCSGCLHSPPNYPGAGGLNINPAEYVNSECPNINGRYEGKGVLLDGDATAKQFAKTRRIDENFPFVDNAEADAFMRVADSDGGPRSSYPTYGDIMMISKRSFRFTVDYKNGKRASRVVSFDDSARYVCTGIDGRIVWGGASKGGRSEFGPNSSDSIVIIYLDEEGNLITERSMQVHMTLLAGAIPAGTARHFSKYRFKRIP